MRPVLAVLLALGLPTAAFPAPPDLVEGSFQYDFGSTHDETLVRCGTDWVLTWGAHSWPLRAEGDAWVHPHMARCKAGGACSGGYRLLYAEGHGLSVNRYNAARAAQPDFDAWAFSGTDPFTWQNHAAPVDGDLRAFLCDRIEDWPYLPPNE